jgi:hypothetical protein
MRPKEPRDSGQKDLFRARLHQIIDMGHPLAKLVRKVFSLHAPEVECIGKGNAHRPKSRSTKKGFMSRGLVWSGV